MKKNIERNTLWTNAIQQKQSIVFTAVAWREIKRKGKEMLKVTPKMVLGTRQTKPKCLTNRQQIELHTAYSESTLCNLNWALCLHLPHTHTHTRLHLLRALSVCVCRGYKYCMYACDMWMCVWVNAGLHLDTEWITRCHDRTTTTKTAGKTERWRDGKAAHASDVAHDYRSLKSWVIF